MTLLAPAYGTSSLAELIPAVLSSIGTPGFANVLDLPPAPAVCVLLIDGLGAELLRAHAGDAPVLSAALAAGRDLTAGFPSTTAVSIGSIGTGLPPGGHGILGYKVAIPGAGRLMSSLQWDRSVDPLRWQPCTTAFERAVAAGTRYRARRWPRNAPARGSACATPHPRPRRRTRPRPISR